MGISSSCCDSIFVIFNKLRDGHCSSHKIDNSKYFVIDFSNTGYRSCFKIPGAQLLFERTVLDDLMFANSEFLSKIYSVYSHHFHFSVLMTVQNLFHKGLREISLNAQIMVFFKSCRDVNQIVHFLRQVYPKTYKNALEAYKNAVSSDRGYLVIDLRCETHDNQRLRSGIFPEDTHYLYQ